MRKFTKYYRWVLAVILLYVLLQKIDISETVSLLVDFSWGWLVFIVGLIVVSYVFNTLRWQALLFCHHKQVGFWRLLRYRLVGAMYGNILPSSFSGEMARAYYLTKSNRIDMPQAFSTVLVEKMSGVVAMAVYLVIGLILNIKSVHENQIYYLLLSVLILMLLVAVLLFSKKFKNLSPARFRNSKNKAIVFLKKYYQAIHLYRDYRSVVLFSVAISFLVQGFTLLINYFAVRGLDINLDFSQVLLAIPLITISNLIPVSVGNWGWREGVYVYALSLFGVGSVPALALALFMRIIKLAVSLFGLLFAFGNKNFNFFNIRS